MTEKQKPELKMIKGGSRKVALERDLLALHLKPGITDPVKREAITSQLEPRGKLMPVK